MGQLFNTDDMLFHMLAVGGTGSGKTNAVLHMLKLLFNKKEPEKPQPALFLFDPGGDASIDLLRAIPKSKWKDRVVILDPQYVSFGFNLLSLPEGLTPEEKTEVLQTQVEEFSILLSDVFNTDATFPSVHEAVFVLTVSATASARQGAYGLSFPSTCGDVYHLVVGKAPYLLPTPEVLSPLSLTIFDILMGLLAVFVVHTALWLYKKGKDQPTS